MLHFAPDEYAARLNRLMVEMAEQKLDAMLLFAQDSMYWLTGYDTFGFCFFQCLIVKADGEMKLLTRSADLRQAADAWSRRQMTAPQSRWAQGQGPLGSSRSVSLNPLQVDAFLTEHRDWPATGHSPRQACRPRPPRRSPP